MADRIGAANIPEDLRSWLPCSTAEAKPYLLTAFLALIVFCSWSRPSPSYRALPAVNEAWGGLFSFRAKWRFLLNGKSLMAYARTQYPHQPYRMMTDLGEVAVLPPELADEIRNEPKMSFSKAAFNALEDFHGHIRGFEAFSAGNNDDQLIQTVARKQLTKRLAQVTEPLSEEAAFALSINLGASTDWHEVVIKQPLLDIIARMSSRVFLNEQLCRNEQWLRVTKEYTVNVFIAATKLRLFPKFLRPLANLFLPDCITIRRQSDEARRVIAPAIEERRELRRLALEAGDPLPEYNDALDWIEEAAVVKGATYDPAITQLILSVAAIHTTTDLLEQVMLDVAQNPEFFQLLRAEIAQNLGAHSWQKSSLYNMKLLDSVIKESQRLKPISISSMRRIVVDPIQLSTGLKLNKGTRLQVDSCRMWDPTLHHDPERWDGRRFLQLRSQPGSRANGAHLVSTSADHLGFGHGEHACPGRFFAANEIKIALCHLLMKYDWELMPGTSVKPLTCGFSNPSNPTAKIRIRLREKMEVDVDAI